jgi:hypothetical protein
MAVTINVGTQRHENNPNENFEEVADQNTEQEAGSQSQLSQQSGSHANSPAPEPIAPPPEETPPPPAFARYGFGDTVVMGAPDYVRAYVDRAEPSAGEPSLHTTAFALAPHAENTPASAGTATTVKPIPMRKPGSNLNQVSALISPQSQLQPEPAPLPTYNAPQIGGASVVAPAVGTAKPGSDLTFEQSIADLTLGDPLNRELIARYDQEHTGANLVEHGNVTADHLVTTYGEARLNDMAKLHHALAGVRDDYLNALTAAETACASNADGRFRKAHAAGSGLSARSGVRSRLLPKQLHPQSSLQSCSLA